MQDHFTQKGPGRERRERRAIYFLLQICLAGDVEGEADCLLAAGSLLVLQGDLDEARSLAAKAQLILSEEPCNTQDTTCRPTARRVCVSSPCVCRGGQCHWRRQGTSAARRDLCKAGAAQGSHQAPEDSEGRREIDKIECERLLRPSPTSCFVILGMANGQSTGEYERERERHTLVCLSICGSRHEHYTPKPLHFKRRRYSVSSPRQTGREMQSVLALGRVELALPLLCLRNERPATFIVSKLYSRAGLGSAPEPFCVGKRALLTKLPCSSS